MANQDDDKRNYDELLKLATIRERSERERRVKALMGRIGKSREYVKDHRLRLIQDAMTLRQDWSEAEATQWVDGVLGIEPIN